MSRQRHITLTGWFVANQEFHCVGTYTNFPDEFVWDKSKREWKLRVKGHGTMIGRMYAAHPGEGERFYIRMLLNHVTGCTRFQDIRTLADGTEAPRRLGLLEDDTELDQCLAEAAVSVMPPQMRQLFVTILLFSVPTDPLALWEHHQASLSDDFLCRAKRVVLDVQLDEHILNCVLLDIENRLQRHGKSLEDYPGMPVPKHMRNLYEEPRIIQNELDYCVSDLLEMVLVNVRVSYRG